MTGRSEPLPGAANGAASPRRKLGSPGGVLFGAVVAWVVLAVTVQAAMLVPEEESLSGLPGAAAFDYSAFLHTVTPLDPAFIAEILGPTPRGEVGLDDAADPADPVPAQGETAAVPPRTEPPPTRPEPTVVEHPPTNDDFGDAFPVAHVPFNARTDGRGASRQQGEPSDCAPIGGTLWYRYRPTLSRGLLANTFGTDYETALGVYEGNALPQLRTVACDTDLSGDSQVPFATERGKTYYIQVSGIARGGTLRFALLPQGITERVSLSRLGAEGDDWSRVPALSGDGRFVAFDSAASNLVPGDANVCANNLLHDMAMSEPNRRSCPDIFVRDRLTGRMELVSVSSEGDQANGASYQPSLSHDGRFVAFASEATNLVDGMASVCVSKLTVTCPNIYVHDRRTGVTELASVSLDGGSANEWSYYPEISADGRHVVFQSNATNLAPGDTNQWLDTFVYDRAAHRVAQVSVTSEGRPSGLAPFSPDGALGSDISADGRYVAFESSLQGLVAGDANLTLDVFVHDRDVDADGIFDERHRGAIETTRASVSSGGREGNGYSIYPALSADGRMVAFFSAASNLVPRDIATCAHSYVTAVGHTQAEVPQPPGLASVLVHPNCLDVFVHDRLTGRTTMASVASSGEQSDGSSVFPDISADGRFTVFRSHATNFVPVERSSIANIFVHDALTGETRLVSVSSTGAQAATESFIPSISADGRVISFGSAAPNLSRGDGNSVSDIFVHRAWMP